MEKIDLVKILKNCPTGMELDCSMFDNVILSYVREDSKYPIGIETPDGIIALNKYGGYFNTEHAKCIIFPKGKTTWEGFQRPFKDGDIVATEYGVFIGIVKAKNNGSYETYCAINGVGSLSINTSYCFERFATEEEKEKLFKAIKDNGYKWNEETKTLEKLIVPKFKVGDRIILKYNQYNIPSIRINAVIDGQYILENGGFLYIDSTDEKYVLENKFDINTLVPFESRVLVRDNDYDEWKGAFWSHLRRKADIKYDTIRGVYRQCIPYNDDTKHLLGKTNDCDEYFKNWK